MLNAKNLWRIFPFFVALLLAGCQHAPPHIYHWGGYEDVIYTDYAEPNALSLSDQAKQLESDIQNAAAEGRPTPPGVHAQLGYVYSKMGNADAAIHEFEIEKKLFPESSIFMDRFISNLSGGNEKKADEKQGVVS